jgi:hypothetical protein
MIRSLVTALFCAAAIVAGDVAFRTSLLRDLRPLMLSPSNQAVLEPPVEVRWEGPQRMRVWLAISGEKPRDLGIHESPMEIGAEEFVRDGGYEVELRALRLGNWIRTMRRFQVHMPAAVPQPAAEDHPAHGGETKSVLRALDAVRTARDNARGRAKFLSEENAALREESGRLAQQLEAQYKAQEDDAARAEELERRLSQLGEENRALAEENAAIRLRLSTVIPCTVWGYYSYPHPQTIPVTRRVLMVSDMRGQIFRAQAECEIIRRADPTAASLCFCVGNSWGG